MEKAKKLLKIALAEVGQKESPTNSNKTKYGKWFGWDGVMWCGIFVSWCFDKAGMPLGNIGFTKGFAGCQTAVNYFRKKGLVVADPQEGDIVFFDWNGDGRYDHVGIFLSKIDKKFFNSIEGNTSLSNQSNGGEVMKRKRDFKYAIFVRPAPLM